MDNTQQHKSECSTKESMKNYTRYKCQIQHYTNMLSEVCTKEHKQNTKKLNMRNIHTEDMQEVQTEESPHTDMASMQQYKKEF